MGHFVRSKSILQFFPVADQGITLLNVDNLFVLLLEVGGWKYAQKAQPQVSRQEFCIAFLLL